MDAVFVYLNNNQGAMITILTAVYVLATLITIGVIHKSNKIGKEAILSSIKMEKEKNRPYVIFDLIVEKNVIHAVLKNIGCTPAINVILKIEDKFKNIHINNKITNLANKKIAFMAPGRLLKDFINTATAIYNIDQEHNYKVTIEYQDTNNNSYKEEQIVDLEHNKGLSYIVDQNYLKEIHDTMKRICGYINDIQKSINILAWEHNSLVEQKKETELDKYSLNTTNFLKEHFKADISGDVKVYFDLMTCHHTKEGEKVRNNMLHCEKLGLVRRERNYFVLTEKGHEKLGEEKNEGLKEETK